MTRDALHALIREIPDDRVNNVAELLEAYRRGDRLAVQLLFAPADHAEPGELDAIAALTDDDLATAAPIETVKRRLGLYAAPLRPTARGIFPTRRRFVS
jgi:hypothetical protein